MQVGFALWLMGMMGNRPLPIIRWSEERVLRVYRQHVTALLESDEEDIDTSLDHITGSLLDVSGWSLDELSAAVRRHVASRR